MSRMIDSMRSTGPDRRYLDLSVDELLVELASPSPVPGSGFAAAVAIAMGAATITMAARLSPDWPEGRGAAAQAETLRKRVMELASRNAEAYSAALAALRGQEEKYRTRDETMGDALARAADIPLQIGDAATSVAALAAEVADRGESRFGADCAAAASLAVAGARAAATLVEVNLGTTGDDPRVKRAHALIEDASASLQQALAAVA
jgi:formiminotetrahydrofolate cyclodeaminase